MAAGIVSGKDGSGIPRVLRTDTEGRLEANLGSGSDDRDDVLAAILFELRALRLGMTLAGYCEEVKTRDIVG